ncbi:hypothetical protein WM457_02982 (plasmid) [Clavibacter nebraskensis]
MTYLGTGNTIPKPKKRRRSSHVEMLAHDYGSLTESVIENFARHVRAVNPRALTLHNPPGQVAKDVLQHFGAETVEYVHSPLTEDTLHRFNAEYDARIVGQHRVKRQLLSLLHAHVTDSGQKPLVLMLYGPSGVGKTETALFLSDILGGELLRTQFSMFQTGAFYSYLFGGKHSEDSFARDLLDRESNVILIDEFDKADSSLFSAFYELFDDGIFEDRHYRVNLGPAIILCTSNYSSEHDAQRALGDALASRFDELVPYAALSRLDMERLARTELEQRYEDLSSDDKERVVSERAHELVSSMIRKDGNVRRLKKIVRQVLSRLVVDSKYPDPK